MMANVLGSGLEALAWGMDGCTDGQHIRSILQDIVPVGPLPKKDSLWDVEFFLYTVVNI